VGQEPTPTAETGRLRDSFTAAASNPVVALSAIGSPTAPGLRIVFGLFVPPRGLRLLVFVGRPVSRSFSSESGQDLSIVQETRLRWQAR